LGLGRIIHHGKWGVDGLLNIVKYFVEENGTSEGLFEGKLGPLMQKLEKRNLRAISMKPTL
jgi:hypothetical protein